MTPHARQDKILVQEVGSELVVYDQQRHRAHRLNPAAAVVWQHCDGLTTTAEIAALLQRECSLPADEEIVGLALNQLERAHLLQKRVKQPGGGEQISRRQVMQRLGRVGALALLLPAVTSIISPTPAMAVSKDAPFHCCVFDCRGRGNPPHISCQQGPCQQLSGCDIIRDRIVANCDRCNP